MPAFIDAMAASKAPATVRRYLSSIPMLHRRGGLGSSTEALQVKLALKRMHREKGRSQRQAAGVIFPLVTRLLDAAGERQIDLRNAALLSLAYDTLCRRSELVALEVRDFDIGGEDGGTVFVRRSKTARRCGHRGAEITVYSSGGAITSHLPAGATRPPTPQWQ